MNSYDMLIEKGKIEGKAEGKIEGKIEERILTIRSMLLKKLSIDLIAEVKDVKKEYVKQIQVELKQEKKIRKLLQAKKFPKKIAVQLKVSEILVKTIKNLVAKKKAKQQKQITE